MCSSKLSQPPNELTCSSRYRQRLTRQSWINISGPLWISLALLLPLVLIWRAPAQAAAGQTSPTQSENDYAIPLSAVPTTTLQVEILSSPWVTVDHNGVIDSVDGRLPKVFVVEAAVTNNGSETATDLLVTLDFNSNGSWALLAGEEPDRAIAELAPGAVYHAYWFATYPHLPANLGESHQYTVTASAANADPVSTSDNAYGNPVSGKTVQTRSTVGSGNSALTQTSAEIIVGVAFTMTQVYDLGTNAQDAAFNPVGNDDFDPSAYRLLATEVSFYNSSQPQQQTIIKDRVYFDSLPQPSGNPANRAQVTYTFIALLPSSTTICSYVALDFSPAKYDQNFCSALSQTSVTIDGTVSLDLTKQVSSQVVAQNEILNYTISYTNTGDQALQYAWIWDDIPTNIASILSNTISPASDPDESSSGRIAWNLGTIPANSGDSFSFSVLVDGGGQDLADGSILLNQANFGIDPGQLPDQAALTSTVTSNIQAPTIAFSKSDGQTTALPGDHLVYTLQITNSGSIAATGLVVSDTLPADVILAGPTTPVFSSQNGQILVWNNLGSVAAHGGTLNITIPVQIDPDLSQDGTVLMNSAALQYQNSAGHTFVEKGALDTTTVEIPEAELSFSKTAEDLNGELLLVGDTIRYSLQVTNTGAFTAYNVTVTDDLPSQVTCQSVTGPNAPACADPLVWTLSPLGVNDTVTLLIDVTINSGAQGQSIVNSASVTSTNVVVPSPEPEVCPDGSAPVGDQCSTTPTPTTELALTKTAEDLNGAPLRVGDTLRYTLQVTNTGTATALDVTVTDDLPSQVTCQSVTGPDAPACADPLVWTIASLAANSTAVLTIDVTVNSGAEGQSIINSASVTSTNVVDPSPEPEVCPDGSTPVGGLCSTVPEAPPTSLGFSKTAQDVNGGLLLVGDTIRYSLQVTNTGSYTAFNVQVTDDLPSQVTCQSVTGPSAPACADPLVWTIASLAANDTAVLTVDVKVNSGTEGQSIINNATVSAVNVVDPTPEPEVCPDGSTPVAGQCSLTPTPTTQLALTKTARDLNGVPLLVGDTIRYSLQVTNTGSYTAFNVKVTDDLPNQVTCKSVSGSNAPACADPLIWTLPSLAANHTAVLTIDVTVKTGTVGQSIINSASVTAANVVSPGPGPTVCPNGSAPVGGVCGTKVVAPAPAAEPKVYLPLIIRN